MIETSVVIRLQDFTFDCNWDGSIEIARTNPDDIGENNLSVHKLDNFIEILREVKRLRQEALPNFKENL